MLTILHNHFYQILSGIGTTLFLLVIALVAGMILSLCFATIKYQQTPILKQLVSAFVFCIRGTPFLVQLFIIYYGPLQFHWLAHSWLGIPFKSATFCALLALTFNTTAYTTSLFYGGMKNLPQAEITAGKALGLSKIHIFCHIIFPRFFSRVFPIYKNEVIMLLKCTSLVSTITILDIMGTLQQIMTQTYQTIPCLLIAGMLYLGLTIILNLALKKVYKTT